MALLRNAALVSIGDELLIGQILDSNSQWISQQLTNAGFLVQRKITIGDKETDIISTVLEAWKDFDLVITTGGLGPTNDDLTVASLAKAFQAELMYEPAVELHIQKLFGKRGRVMNDLNKKQAFIPDGFEILNNVIGTAPGLLKKEGEKMLAVFPGVPIEMKNIFVNEFLPKAVAHFKTQKMVTKTILTMGIGESSLAQLLNEWESSLPETVKLAYLPSFGSVRLRLNSFDEKLGIAELEALFRKTLPLIQHHIVAWDDVLPEQALALYLKNYKLTLSTAESCTGGALSAAIVSQPGSSSYFNGSVVAYHNQIKKNVLGVSEETLNLYGAVSQECVVEMANNCRTLFGTDIAVSISGIAGPDGGTDEKPVGTVWLALSTSQETLSKKIQLTQFRDYNIKAAVNSAIYLIIAQLNKQFGNEFLWG